MGLKKPFNTVIGVPPDVAERMEAYHKEWERRLALKWHAIQYESDSPVISNETTMNGAVRALTRILNYAKEHKLNKIHMKDIPAALRDQFCEFNTNPAGTDIMMVKQFEDFIKTFTHAKENSSPVGG